MRLLFQLHHPAHYHLFKHSMQLLEKHGHTVKVVIKSKDVLENLLHEDNRPFTNIGERSGGKREPIVYGLLRRLGQLNRLIRKWDIDIMVGSTADIALMGKYCKKPSVVFFEDDLRAVPAYAFLVAPFAGKLVCPVSCSAWMWDSKAVKYEGYHELAYLHPNHFKPNKEIISTLFMEGDKYVLLRFSSLDAYHDKGKSGISDDLALKIIDICDKDAKVWIVSERPLAEKFAKYRFPLSASLMHHALAYAALYIGDSQTMAAEAAVLGTPSIRYNDFVGKLGYLEELEHRYGLTVGVSMGQESDLLALVVQNMADGKPEPSVLSRLYREKIDVSEYIVNILEQFEYDIERY